MIVKRSLLAFLLSVLCACAQPETAILIEAQSQGDVDRLIVDVIDPQGDQAPARVIRPINRRASDITAEDPIRIAVPVGAGRAVMVHLVASHINAGVEERYVATRCYATGGVLRDTVLLVGPLQTTTDGDGDGFVEDSGSICRDPGADGQAVECDHGCGERGDDCDDSRSERHPGAAETCQDGIDQDCDGEDEGCADDDDDGYQACSGMEPIGTCDCEDRDPSVRPGAVESCRDGIDQNCDGIDQSCDQDGDGFSADRDVGGSPDCDDTDPQIRPGRDEVCTPEGEDVVDENCNGFVDEGCAGDDLDTDGFCACGVAGCASPCDQNDCDAAVHPNALDVCGNGVDEDQDGVDPTCPLDDVDGDGRGPTTGDCNDADPRTFPGAPDRCGDGIAQNCIADSACGTNDADQDGYTAPADCNDASASAAPFSAEVCNGLDDDCDGTPDEVLARPELPDFAQGLSGCVLRDTRSCPSGQPCALNFRNDRSHCGGCRLECDPRRSDVCANGQCDCSFSGGLGACADGSACCSDAAGAEGAGCRDLSTDFLNCGFCLQRCTQAADRCEGGACRCGSATACNPDSRQSTCCGGGCVDPQTDPNHCGGCNRACGENATCVEGQCRCASNYGNCDGSVGCETFLPTSIPHCGGCNRLCDPSGATGLCSAGTCSIESCDPLRGDCDRDNASCETALDSLSNCGTCGTGCSRPNATAQCPSGNCTIASCNPGWANCDNVDGSGCERNIRTLSDCGGCGVGCDLPHASESCNSGSCRIVSCEGGWRNCDSSEASGCEVNTQTDSANCGGCGISCGSGGTCVGGGCVCSGTFRNCDGAPGCEVDSATSLSNCGACGNTCGSNESCSGGRCRCGSSVADIGSGQACAGAAECCFGSCAAVATDTANCGACGAICGLSETCSSGTCRCGGTAGSVGSGFACSVPNTSCSGSQCVCGGSPCPPDRADSCVSGICRCGGSGLCPIGSRCVNGTCS